MELLRSAVLWTINKTAVYGSNSQVYSIFLYFFFIYLFKEFIEQFSFFLKDSMIFIPLSGFSSIFLKRPSRSSVCSAAFEGVMPFEVEDVTIAVLPVIPKSGFVAGEQGM